MLPTPYVPPHKRVGSGTGSDSGEEVVAGGCLPAAREGYDVDDARAVVTTTMITFGIVSNKGVVYDEKSTMSH